MQTQIDETETLELTLPRRAALALGLAAKDVGCSVSEFVLQSALAHAVDLLPDRQHFRLDAEKWEAFMAALDAPPRKLARLTHLLKQRGRFDAEPG